MPHFLCFTDLALARSTSDENGSLSVGEENTNADDEDPSSTAFTSASSTATALFVREENKKSSFALQNPYALVTSPADNGKVEVGNDQAELPVENAPNADDNDGQVQDADVTREDSEPNLFAEANRKFVKKETMSATASISSSIYKDDDGKDISSSREMFLFGGFELTTNVKTVEVYVNRTNDAATKTTSKKKEETYLTTTKGVPLRDLPPLDTTPPYIYETKVEDPNTTTDDPKSNIEDDNPSSLRENGTDTFYKFILVSPGGPKPMERVRLKFVSSKDSCASGTIIVHTLKVKGRLSDSIPKASQQQQSFMPSQQSFPFGVPNNFGPAGMRGGGQQRQDNTMNSLSSMMAMMGGGNDVMGMPMQMNAQQQQIRQMQMQPINQKQVQQDQNNHQQEKNQAEIMSSVAGLGMFLKSSEERTMKQIETMVADMEGRIMKRFDTLAERMDLIESSINNKSADDGGSDGYTHLN